MKAIIAGVYFLFDGKDIVYVGQSADIFRRIYEHSSGRAKGEKKKFDTWEYIEIPDEAERFRAENLLILALRPKYNIDYSGANARCVIGKQRSKNVNKQKVSKIEYLVNKFDKITNSVSLGDMDYFFGFPNGTFSKLVLDRTIPPEDCYHERNAIWECRIRFDAAYEMAQKMLRDIIGDDE